MFDVLSAPDQDAASWEEDERNWFRIVFDLYTAHASVSSNGSKPLDPAFDLVEVLGFEGRAELDLDRVLATQPD